MEGSTSLPENRGYHVWNMTSQVGLRTGATSALSRKAMWKKGCLNKVGGRLCQSVWKTFVPLVVALVHTLRRAKSGAAATWSPTPATPEEPQVQEPVLSSGCLCHTCELSGALASVQTLDATLENNLSEKVSTWKLVQLWLMGCWW